LRKSFRIIHTIPNTPSNVKIRIVRGKLNPLIEQWQRICILAERIIKRREAAAVRTPPAFRRSYLPTHFTLPHLSSTVSSLPHSASSSPSILSTSSNVDSIFGFRYDHFTEQSDLARLTNTLRAVTEVNQPCWRGDECELSNGVRMGLEQLAAHTQRHSELSELRV
jgi:sorting nexin-8